MKFFARTLMTVCMFLAASFYGLSQPPPSMSATKGAGLWIARDSITGVFTVTRVVANAAAATAGARTGDVIIAVDGQPVAGKTMDNVIVSLRGGAAGNPYKISISRKIKTSLGETTKAMELQIVPALIAATTCISGDCVNGEGKLMNNHTGRGFEGTFVNGSLVKGNTYYPNGRLFQSGNLKDGKLEGAGGTAYYDEPDNLIEQQGTFVAGRLISGTFYHLATKTKYTGNWDETGKRHGKDFTMSSPTFYFKGNFDHDVALEAEKMTYKSGYYEGPLVAGKPEGKGRYLEGSYVYIGHFTNGLMEGKFRRLLKTKGGKYENIYYYRAGVEQ